MSWPAFARAQGYQDADTGHRIGRSARALNRCLVATVSMRWPCTQPRVSRRREPRLLSGSPSGAATRTTALPNGTSPGPRSRWRQRDRGDNACAAQPRTIAFATTMRRTSPRPLVRTNDKRGPLLPPGDARFRLAMQGGRSAAPCTSESRPERERDHESTALPLWGMRKTRLGSRRYRACSSVAVAGSAMMWR